MLTDDVAVPVESSSKNAVREYNNALDDPAGWIHEATTAVLLMEVTENDVGGARAVNTGVWKVTGSGRP